MMKKGYICKHINKSIMIRKNLYKSLLLIAAVIFCISLSSCSKEEREATFYYFKTVNVSSGLSTNSEALYKIQQLLVTQYDEGVQYMVTDETKAKQKFQKAVTDIQNFDWQQNGFTLQDNSSFTLELISKDNTVVASQSIILK
jgi:hypothetical protein